MARIEATVEEPQEAEVAVQDGDPGIEEGTESSTSDEISEIAQELGWVPEDDFSGDPDTYVDAKTYILRSKEINDTMRDHIRSQKKEIKEIKQAVGSINSHYDKLYESRIGKLKAEIADLKTQKKEAVAEGDLDKVEDLDDQIDVLREEERTATKEKGTKQSEPNPEFEQWRDDNTWYGKDEEMTAYADAQANAPDLKGLPPKRFFAEVTRRAKQMFPEKFPEKKKTAKPAASAVEAGGRQTGIRKKFTVRDLTSTQKLAMEKFNGLGVMTQDEYIAQLVEMGELK